MVKGYPLKLSVFCAENVQREYTMAKQPNDEVQIHFELPRGLRDAFKIACAGQDQSVSQVLRAFARAYVRANGKGQMDLFAKSGSPTPRSPS